MTTLIIVESPSKCKKIEYFLGEIDKNKIFSVVPSSGHFREISSIDKKTFEVKYKYSKGKFKYIQNIRKKIGKNTEIMIATDNDREGESIGWHLCDILNLSIDKVKRLRFNEISFQAVKNAYENPSLFSKNLIDAALTRQIIDRWIGFHFSPLLSTFCNQRGLSAGRCQTPTLKLICDNNIINENKNNDTVFRINGTFHKYIFSLQKTFEKKEDAINFFKKNIVFPHKFQLPHKVEKKERYPPKPFKTSTIQQYCSTYWKWSPMVTMKNLQELYEKGLITYHRTESTELSNSFIKKGLEYIENEYGEKYKKKNPNYQPNKTAHEAIRTTDITKIEIKFNHKLYSLIRKQTLQSLMSSAEIEETYVKIHTPEPDLFFEKTFKKILFDGFLCLEKKETNFKIPKKIKPIEKLELKEVPKEESSFYNEGGIIKKLEELKIGRPSTFASFISKILLRNYVEKKETIVKESMVPLLVWTWELSDNKKDTIQKNEIKKEEKPYSEKQYNKLIINDLGKKVINYIYKEHSECFNYEYTSEIEKYLDDIAEGKLEKDTLLKEIYEKLKK